MIKHKIPLGYHADRVNCPNRICCEEFQNMATTNPTIIMRRSWAVFV